MPKVKVPKRVAGVKVPKKLRREAKRALNFADSPAVRDLALAGLTLAAENLLDRSKARQTATAALDAARVTRDATKASLKALDLGDILRAAAVEGARRFLEGFEEAQRSNAAAAATSARAAKTGTAAKAAKRPGRKPAAKRPAATRAKTAKQPARKPAAKTLSAKRPAASKPTKAAPRPRRRKASGRSAGAAAR